MPPCRRGLICTTDSIEGCGGLSGPLTAIETSRSYPTGPRSRHGLATPLAIPVRVFRMIPDLGSDPVVLGVWYQVDGSQVIEYQSRYPERLSRWTVLPIWGVLLGDLDSQTF